MRPRPSRGSGCRSFSRTSADCSVSLTFWSRCGKRFSPWCRGTFRSIRTRSRSNSTAARPSRRWRSISKCPTDSSRSCEAGRPRPVRPPRWPEAIDVAEPADPNRQPERYGRVYTLSAGEAAKRFPDAANSGSSVSASNWLRSLVDLADGSHRQFLDELDLLWRMRRAFLRFHEINRFIRVGRAPLRAEAGVALIQPLVAFFPVPHYHSPIFK